MTIRSILFSAAVWLLGATTAIAQDQTLGPGKVELGFFPLGGLFLVGGDDDGEVNFNEYTTGASLSYHVNPRFAIEGELTVNLGLAQDIFFHQSEVFHVQMPNVWSYFGNLVFYPRGSEGRNLPFYIAGGVGLLSLQSREPTKPLGYDVDSNPWETFMAENIGVGVKMFRESAPEWGFRADYRYLFINANDSAPEFFASEKNRGGHRIYFGVLYGWKR